MAKIEQFYDETTKRWVKVDLSSGQKLGSKESPWANVPQRLTVKEATETAQDANERQKGASGGDQEPKEWLVKASMTDDEVVELASRGDLRFSFEDFRELDGRVLDKLNRLSLDRYVVELQAYRRKVAREGMEGEYGKFPRIEVMGDNALGRLKVEGLPEGWHHYWELPENMYARKKMGYVTVDGRFPTVVAGDKTAGGTHQVVRNDGSPELVLMACPKETADELIRRQADESHGKLRAAKDHLAENVEKAVPGVPTSFEQRVAESIKIARDE